MKKQYSRGKKIVSKKQGPAVTRARKRKVEIFDNVFELSGHKTKKIKQYFCVESEQSTDDDKKMEPPIPAADRSISGNEFENYQSRA